MPADITGTEVIQEERSSGERSFRFLPGPVFTNVLLADEINRTPPEGRKLLYSKQCRNSKSRSAVSVTRCRNRFFVLATQNPIEQEGTYPLPEAQLDRFMFEVLVDYPDEDEELQIYQADNGRLYPAGNSYAGSGRNQNLCSTRAASAYR